MLFWVVGVTSVAGRTVGTRTRGQQWLIIAATLAPLVWFKYAAFATEIATSPLRGLGWDVAGFDEQLLPVGISFFTFQALSYVLDIKRGHAEPLDGVGRYLLYISLFPQLIAGPTVRFSEIREQLYTRRFSAENLSAGSARFTLGLSKKVVIADSVAPMADVAFAGGFEASSLAAGHADLSSLRPTPEEIDRFRSAIVEPAGQQVLDRYLDLIRTAAPA